jgi:pimeloyl-ACP methyl ester carboxylesterase
VRRIALLAHGAGSCPDTVRRLLGPAVPEGVDTVAVDARGGVDDLVARLADAAAARDVVLVAGVSLGAHAAALWAARGGRTAGLLLAMPAWTGPPGDVAALTAASAADVLARGRAAVLADLERTAPDDWVVAELRRGWATYDDDAELADVLRAAASSPGPTLQELALLDVPTAVVALAGDPVHPERVARAWAGAIPGAGLAVLDRRAPDGDRGALGRAGRALLDESRRAGGVSGSR